MALEISERSCGGREESGDPSDNGDFVIGSEVTRFDFLCSGENGVGIGLMGYDAGGSVSLLTNSLLCCSTSLSIAFSGIPLLTCMVG